MTDAENSTRRMRRLVMIGAFFGLGGFCMIALSTGSTPND